MVMKPFKTFLLYAFDCSFGPDRAEQHSYNFELTDQKKHRINLFSYNL